MEDSQLFHFGLCQHHTDKLISFSCTFCRQLCVVIPGRAAKADKFCLSVFGSGELLWLSQVEVTCSAKSPICFVILSSLFISVVFKDHEAGLVWQQQRWICLQECNIWCQSVSAGKLFLFRYRAVLETYCRGRFSRCATFVSFDLAGSSPHINLPICRVSTRTMWWLVCSCCHSWFARWTRSVGGK